MLYVNFKVDDLFVHRSPWAWHRNLARWVLATRSRGSRRPPPGAAACPGRSSSGRPPPSRRTAAQTTSSAWTSPSLTLVRPPGSCPLPPASCFVSLAPGCNIWKKLLKSYFFSCSLTQFLLIFFLPTFSSSSIHSPGFLLALCSYKTSYTAGQN